MLVRFNVVGFHGLYCSTDNSVKKVAFVFDDVFKT